MNTNSAEDRRLTKAMFIMPIGSAVGFVAAYWLDAGLGNPYALQTFAASALLSFAAAAFVGVRIWRRTHLARSDRAERREGERVIANHMRNRIAGPSTDFSDFADLGDKRSR